METKAIAVHAHAHAHDNDDWHAVALGAIRVLICEKAGEWFAQGIEIDYAASGSSLEDVQHRFERGLAATVDLHLRRFSTPHGLLKFAPKEAWEKLVASGHFDFSMVTTHDLAQIEPNLGSLPFRRIAYLQQSAA